MDQFGYKLYFLLVCNKHHCCGIKQTAVGEEHGFELCDLVDNSFQIFTILFQSGT